MNRTPRPEQRVRCCYCGDVHTHGPISEREAPDGGDVGRMSHCGSQAIEWYWFAVTPAAVVETHPGTAPRYAQETRP